MILKKFSQTVLRFRHITVVPILSMALLLGLFSSLFIQTGAANALSGASFQAGDIIDNGIFTNSGAMSVNQIQTFLNAKVGSCDNNGSHASDHYNSATSSYYTDGQWSALNGQSSTFTCIDQYVENTSTLQNNFGNYQESIPGGISAAQIIWNAAQDYQINPEVLLVTLQKEQGLVTDYWPWIGEYTYAMEYACPDTGSCSGTYADFYKQVDGAAWQFRQYLNNPTHYNYTVGQDYVQYNPTSSCGGSVVDIQNQATAALYDYTPYQPNAAALANLTGSGDSCSAYGNRNFWYYFNTWFGSSLASGYEATNYGQTPALSLYPGQNSTMTFTYRNTGGATWYDDDSVTAGMPAVHLACAQPINCSGYFSSAWPNAGRPATTFSAVYDSDGVTLAANQHEVLPGEIGALSFPVDVPSTAAAGSYDQYVEPVADGAAYWDMGALGETVINVLNPNAATVVSFSPVVAMHQNESATAMAKIQNTGTSTWYDDDTNNGSGAVHLASTNPINRMSVFNSDWPNPTRPNLTFSAVYDSNGVTLATNQHEVLPGEIADYNFTIVAPLNQPAGTYNESFQPVMDGNTNWDMGGGFTFPVADQGSTMSAQLYKQSSYTTLSHGATTQAYLWFRNNGNANWYDDDSVVPGINPVHLATDSPVNRLSALAYQWPNAGRPNVTFSAVYNSDGTTLASNQHVVAPGQIAAFNFDFINNTLSSGQVSQENFTPVLEGAQNWRISPQYVWLDVTGQ
jgi:hypothetical protein